MVTFPVILCSTFVLSVISALAEKHTISFDNQCGYGSPRLIQKGNILSTGDPYTSSGPFWAGIAYLQTGNCLLNGERCTLVEMSLANPTCSGCGSSVDISLIPPLAYSVPASFSYSGGCDGQGATCSSQACKTAFFVPTDNHVQVQCQEDDVNLLITFCAGGSGGQVTILGGSSFATKSAAIIVPSTTVAIDGALGVPLPTSNTTNSTSNVPQCAKDRSRRRRRRSVDTSSNNISPNATPKKHWRPYILTKPFLR